MKVESGIEQEKRGGLKRKDEKIEERGFGIGERARGGGGRFQ